jgi:hypothetical protein
MVVALGGAMRYIWSDHVKKVEDRFAAIGVELKSITTQVEAQTATIAENHAEILKLLLSASEQRQRNADHAR